MRKNYLFKKKRMLSKIAGTAMAVAVTLTTVMGTNMIAAAQWKSNNVGWWYQQDDGSYPQAQWLCDHSTWYYFNADGYMVAGNWVYYHNQWYYMDEHGAMVATNWVNYKGAWYYMNGDGTMVSSGWVGYKGAWYYMNADGMMKVSSWVDYKNNKYYLDADGVMVTGLQVITGKTYFFSTTSGAMQTDWQTVSGNKYYFGTDGAALTGAQTIDGKKYIFDNNGVMVVCNTTTGLVKLNDTLYYYIDGVKQTSWQTVLGKTYYFDVNTGVGNTGFQTIGGKRYYFDTTSCAMATSWQTISGGKYYFGADGVMVTGEQTIDGKKYVFDNTGILAVTDTTTGWVKLNGTWYYYNNGSKQTGWYKDSKGNSYYLELSTGAMVTGFQTISDKTYYFNTTSGAMQTGWQMINGNTYFFADADYHYYEKDMPVGAMLTGVCLIGGSPISESRGYKFDDTTGVLIREVPVHNTNPDNGNEVADYVYIGDGYSIDEVFAKCKEFADEYNAKHSATQEEKDFLTAVQNGTKSWASDSKYVAETSNGYLLHTTQNLAFSEITAAFTCSYSKNKEVDYVSITKVEKSNENAGCYWLCYDVVGTR